MNVWVSISASACVCIQRYVCYKSSVLYSLPILWSGVWVIYAWTYGMEELAPLSYTSLVSKALFLQRILVSIYQSQLPHNPLTSPASLAPRPLKDHRFLFTLSKSPNIGDSFWQLKWSLDMRQSMANVAYCSPTALHQYRYNFLNLR